MALGSLPMPPTAPTGYGRWALIDQTCQVMFVGEGSSRVVFVFPTSTGRADFPTRSQQASAVFRYDPAANNGGWHDSTQFPASVDNPLNGNMYKPLYFDRGQAIHGALNVPTTPASHGCVRLRVGDQDKLVSWLGLQGARSTDLADQRHPPRRAGGRPLLTRPTRRTGSGLAARAPAVALEAVRVGLRSSSPRRTASVPPRWHRASCRRPRAAERAARAEERAERRARSPDPHTPPPVAPHPDITPGASEPSATAGPP